MKAKSIIKGLRHSLLRSNRSEAQEALRERKGVFKAPITLRFENPDALNDSELVVLVPISPLIGRQFVNSIIYLVQRSAPFFRLCRLVIDPGGDPPPSGKSHPYRQAALAKIRQDIVDKYLESADWVAWVDADIVDFPKDLLSELVKRAGSGIAAPILLMDGELNDRPNNKDGFGCGRFFDVAGYVEDLRWARFEYPWFNQPGPVFSLDSVGGCYVVNADIYRRGAKHSADPYSMDFIRKGLVWSEHTVSDNQAAAANCFTEHYSVCQWAKQHGLPVRAFSDLVARHAIV